MVKSVFKFKNYEVQSITTRAGEKCNANIATWAMQSAMKGKFMTIALFKTDYTITLVRESGLLNLNLLAQDQARLIQKLGRRSGREVDKFQKLPHDFDQRGCPFLTEAIGYIQLETFDSADSGDHEIFTCKVLGQKVLNPHKEVLTHRYLKEKGLIR